MPRYGSNLSVAYWMDKEDVCIYTKCVYICTHNGILFSHKKMKLAICNSMDGSRGYYVKWNKSDREWNKSEKDKYHVNSNGESKKQIKQAKQTENRLIDTKNKWMVTKKGAAK